MKRILQKTKLEPSKIVYPIAEVFVGSSENDDSNDVAFDPLSDFPRPTNENSITQTVNVPNNENKGEKKKSKKAKKKLIRLKKKGAKKNRETGKAYLGYRRIGSKVKQDSEKPARKMGMTCSSKFCRKNTQKHCTKFSETERSIIFTKFWEMNWSQKKFYACNLIKILSKKTETANSRSIHRRKYFLMKSNNEMYQVCQLMFLNTLGVKEKMVGLWLKSKQDFGFFEHPDDVQERKNVKRRVGKTYQENQKRKELLKQFLVDFPKLESHYCRKDTDKLYFQTEHRTVTELYNDYQHFCGEQNSRKLSITIFTKMMKELNFSIFKPRKDQCDTCYSYKVGNLSETEFKRHRQEVDIARKEKEKDIKDAMKNLCIVLCMDVEAVQLCPKLLASALYFKLKLQMHNFTVYDIVSHKSVNYVWDETEGELKATIFTTIIVSHIESLILSQNEDGSSCKPIIIYSDGCGYQNRNAILASALYNLAQKYPITIIQKFLIKGHTQMECDSSHALIERKTRNMTIDSPINFVDAVKKARTKPSPLDVRHLTHRFFLNFEDPDIQTFKTIRPGKSVGDPTVNELRSLKYCSRGLFYKTSFNDDYALLPHDGIENDFQPSPLYNARLPITAKKYEHLQELKFVLSKDSWAFYDMLPHK